MQFSINERLHGFSSTCLYIGSSSNNLIGTDAFQECDTTGIKRPCTKHNWLVKDVNDFSRVLHLALKSCNYRTSWSSFSRYSKRYTI